MDDGDRAGEGARGGEDAGWGKRARGTHRPREEVAGNINI